MEGNRDLLYLNKISTHGNQTTLFFDENMIKDLQSVMSKIPLLSLFGQVGAFCGLKCILNRSHARTIVQTVLLSFFSSFTDSMPFELIIIVLQFMFLGRNTFWTYPRVILTPT